MLRAISRCSRAPIARGLPVAFGLPKPNGADGDGSHRDPARRPGFYVVELASPRLGAALLGKPQPMYVPAAALVTNLGVHFKWGRRRRSSG
jgi:hypothetical protein